MNQENTARVQEEDAAEEAADAPEVQSTEAAEDSVAEGPASESVAEESGDDAASAGDSDPASSAAGNVADGQTAESASAPVEKTRRDSASPILSPPVERTTALPTDIDMILDIPVNLSMEIGRTRLTIGELLSLGKGSIVELQRMTDEPMDVLVNGTLVAHGEAVVVGERFGIRLTDVISPSDRLKQVA